MKTSLQIVTESYADELARVQKLDAKASIVQSGLDAAIYYGGYVDFYTGGKLTAHLKN